MRKHFDTYNDAYAYAQARANASGLSFGIERQDGPLEHGYLVFLIPSDPRRRCGHEMRCQAVESDAGRGRVVARWVSAHADD